MLYSPLVLTPYSSIHATRHVPPMEIRTKSCIRKQLILALASQLGARIQSDHRQEPCIFDARFADDGKFHMVGFSASRPVIFEVGCISWIERRQFGDPSW